MIDKPSESCPTEAGKLERSTTACPSCGSTGLTDFYTALNVPIHSVLLVRTRSEATAFPRGNIVLGFCRRCGFITNRAYDPSLQNYSPECEESQGFSPTFNSFQRRVAEQLISRYHLRNKRIIEIGCGKGEFLCLLCLLGDNYGVGFDPAYRSDRTPPEVASRVTFIRDFYSKKYSGYEADFVCCKMTLEHIHDTLAFVSTVKNTLTSQPETTVFFQVPDMLRVLKECTFWDIYYEHCSYFTGGSLARLFRRAGFTVLALRRDYGNQYLMLEAKPSAGTAGDLPEEDDLGEVTELVTSFPGAFSEKRALWEERFRHYRLEGRRVVLWGSGSKAVAFLTTLPIADSVRCVVDINPYRQGTFVPGTGHLIVSPEHLRREKPDVVLVMNPMYEAEIRSHLASLSLAPEVLSLQ